MKAKKDRRSKRVASNAELGVLQIMNMTLFVLPSIESGGICGATVGIDFEPIEFAPSRHLNGLHVHLDGEDALCAKALNAICLAFEPNGVVSI